MSPETEDYLKKNTTKRRKENLKSNWNSCYQRTKNRKKFKYSKLKTNEINKGLGK